MNLNPKQPANAGKNEGDTAVKEESVQPPLEISSLNEAIKIVKDGKDITIIINPYVVEEIGSYRRCPVKINFKEGEGLSVIPMN